MAFELEKWLSLTTTTATHTDYRVRMRKSATPNLNTQSCNRRPLCSTFTFENVGRPIKTSFVQKKRIKNKIKFIIQPFSADTIVFFFFKFKKYFDPQNMKKIPSKVANNQPPTCFYVLAQLPKRPRNRNPVPPKAP